MLAELADKGPLAASRFEHAENTRKGPWWGWSDVKVGLEFLFSWGDVVSAGRANFERIYALPEQIIPAPLRSVQVAPEDASTGTGAARVPSARNRHSEATSRTTTASTSTSTKAAIRELIDAGELQPVKVPGWRSIAYLHRDARIPRRIETAALLSPFDPVVWERTRALDMFGFHYRIEIYTPAPKRIYGYYTLPVLVDDALVGRIDLKSDRQNGVLRVQSAWHEEGAPDGMEERIAPVLRTTAAWQGLDAIEVMDRGDRARSLAAELGTRVVTPSSMTWQKRSTRTWSRSRGGGRSGRRAAGAC